jgi:hypothetical protein
VSFDPGATHYAERFARDRVLPLFRGRRGKAPLIAIATDGEVYGHHHRSKELFLRDLLENRLIQHGMHPVTAEEYVARFPAKRRAMIRERSSWGCPHDLARWSHGCSCTEGSAAWKAPLRTAFDRLAARVDQVFDTEGARHLSDAWAARDAYVDVVDGADTFADWLGRWHGPQTDPRIAELLLEAQRHRLAMYASCAFYWEDVSRIEPGYGIRRGLAAATLLDHEFGTRIESDFVRDLREVRGWRSPHSAAVLHAGA